MAEYQTTCLHCGSGYIAKIVGGMYCSQRCRDAAKPRNPKPKIDQTCLHCGGLFQTNRRARFCSKACSGSAYHLANAQDRNARVREWRSKNPERVKAAMAKFKSENRDQLRDYWMRYAKLHFERRRVQRLQSERKRNAARALSLLIFPIYQPPLEQAHGLPNFPDRPSQNDYRGTDSRT